jgi:putative membrane protein
VSWGLLVHGWQLSWGLDAGAALYGGLYLWAVRAVLRRGGHWRLSSTLSFLGAIGCVLVALQSGIDADDARLLSVHMVQHMLLLMLAPLLLLGGRPALLALRATPASRRAPLARALRRAGALAGPLPCLGIFTVVLLGTHLPAFYDAALRHPALHEAEHLAYLGAGMLMWWPLLDGDPVPARRLGGLGRLIYVLATMPPMALIGAYLNRAPTLVYPAYGPPAQALHVSAVADQAQAGAIMWVAGSMIVVAVGLCSVLAALVAEERRQQARERRAGVEGIGGALR